MLDLVNLHVLNKIRTPDNISVEFNLMLNNLHIGVLKLQNGKWYFKYADEFIAQTDIKPQVNFPNKEKEYISSKLWPFFASRIPGIGQPEVKDFLHKAGLSYANDVDLLKEFGKRTITNQYVLTAI